MTFNIITIFPQIFDSYFNESIVKRAKKEKIITINIQNLRDWTHDKHKTVDDTPYGGGVGMLMKIEPIFNSINDLKLEIRKKELKTNKKIKSKTILLSAKGKTWNQQLAQKYSKLDNIIMVCGRYEGVDERVLNFIDEEISIGDFVLTGGEIGAMVIVDSVSRLLPGVLGNKESAISESHTIPGQLEYPQYTRPEIFKNKEGKEFKVPKVLLSGDHKQIENWKVSHVKKPPFNNTSKSK